MTTCKHIPCRIAGLVQQLNTVHSLCSKGEFQKANEALAMIQSQMQTVSHDLWMEYHISGVVK